MKPTVQKRVHELIASIEAELCEIKQLVDSNTLPDGVAYVHAEGWLDNSISHVVVNKGGYATIVKKDGTTTDGPWSPDQTNFIIKQGYWVLKDQPPAARKFKHCTSAFSNNKYPFVEYKNGRFFYVDKHGHRIDASAAEWTANDMERYVTEGWWIEVPNRKRKK